MIHRRGFLTGLAAALCAPAIIRPGLIMPVKARRPRTTRVWFDVTKIEDRNWLLPIRSCSQAYYGIGGLRWGEQTIIQQLDAETGLWRVVERIHYPGAAA